MRALPRNPAGYGSPVAEDPIDDAITEAERRRDISDRDVTASVEHFRRVVRPVCQAWSLVVDGWLGGGSGIPPLTVRRAGGGAAVLKIAEPGSLDGQARVMTAAAGHAYARVLLWDADRGALLLERLGHDLWTEEPGLAGQARVLVPLLQDAWRVPLDSGQPFEGKAAGLRAILADLGPRYGAAHPHAVAVAADLAGELAASERPEVVCHGDPHALNVLRSGSGWALIDPDGFVGERAYDLGVVLRDGCRELRAAEVARPGAARHRLAEQCRRLAGSAGADPERVWRWAFVERVTTGLYLGWFGHHQQSASFLDTADLLAR